MVVASVILVIVFTTLSQIVVFSTTYFKDEYSESISQEDVRLTAVLIEKDIRRYMAIPLDTEIDQYLVPVNDTELYPNTSTLSVTLGVPGNGTNYVQYLFDKTNYTIERKVFTPEGTTVSNQITSKQISRFFVQLNYDNGIPYVSVEIETIDDARITENDISQKIYLRLPEVNS